MSKLRILESGMLSISWLTLQSCVQWSCCYTLQCQCCDPSIPWRTHISLLHQQQTSALTSWTTSHDFSHSFFWGACSQLCAKGRKRKILEVNMVQGSSCQWQLINPLPWLLPWDGLCGLLIVCTSEQALQPYLWSLLQLSGSSALICIWKATSGQEMS